MSDNKFYSTGRRKTSTARVYLSSGEGSILVNDLPLEEYFGREVARILVKQPIKLVDMEGKFDVKVNVSGGGITGQVEAVRLAISRALCQFDPENRSALKVEGLMTRDPRMVERKKPGQKKARKKFQFSKR